MPWSMNVEHLVVEDIRALPVQLIEAVPGPKYSTILLVPPWVVKIPQTDKEDVREKVLAYRVEPHIVFSKFFEQLIINLHELFSRRLISFEVISYKQHIYFYVYTDPDYFQLVRGQIYAMYPEAEIETVDDYADVATLSKTHNIETTEMALEKPDIFPIICGC